MTRRLRAGIVGAGVFGRVHARKYASHTDVSLSGIFDLKPESAQSLAAEFDTSAFQTFDSLLGEIDVLSITTPASSHFELCRHALKAGCSVLVEKPIAATSKEAEELVRLAEELGLVLALGHQERLVLEALGALQFDEAPILIKADRHAVRTGRGVDVPVAHDLLVHDANLVLSIMGGALPAIISAQAGQTGRVDDTITADLGFSGGVRVRLSASRAAPAPRREMLIRCPSGDLKIDFLNGTVTGLDGYSSSILPDPVGLNIDRFIKAVQSGNKANIVSGEEGLSALWLSEMIDAVARSGQTWLREPGHAATSESAESTSSLLVR
ncbi:MAG: Gfo/Idh/MocA family oxidoreductase [Pseudomonadota bacterium]